MRMGRIGRSIGALAVTFALTGCGGPDAEVSTAKPGPAPAPPTDLKQKFEKPGKPPAAGKPGR